LDAARQRKEHFLSTSVSEQPADRVPEHVAQIIAEMSEYPAPWALGGGWAVDAWTGEVTRDHGDVDIIVFGDDHRTLFEHLRAWQLAHHHNLPEDGNETWEGQRLYPPDHIHGRLNRGEPLPELGALWAEQGWHLDVMFNDRLGDDWVLSREPLVALPVARAFKETALGPTVVPQALIFYKAMDMRHRDKLDLERLLPLLGEEERTWLREALARVGHPWLSRLAG
jgi:hypothetical protein